jgi:ferritin-like metal-binding protein YciE
MGVFSKEMTTMNDLFIQGLGSMYYAEQQILQALPQMVGKTTSSELRSAFENHLAETRNQVLRIERVFEMHGAEPKAGSCPAIDGLIKEADEVAGDIGDKQVLDAALIAAAQSVEHYEIGRYGTLISWVIQLGRDDCASVLDENLQEEKAADQTLTEIAEAEVNADAALSS